MIDMSRLGEVSAEAGARLVVDATQSAGAVRTGVESWGADAVVSSGYKWLGGHGGAAVAALGSEFLGEVPALSGWMGAPDPFEFDPTRVLFADDARRYTQSTMSYVSVAGLTTALDQILASDDLQIQDHAERLAQMLIELVEPHDWRPFRQLGDAGASPHIISLHRRDYNQEAVAERLRTANIVCSSRGGRLRVSLAAYNDENDIEAFVAALTGT
jgi:selenocysteine lyase/cysteine desulfurase